MPIADGPLGSYFGMFADKYGIQWMVDFTQNIKAKVTDDNNERLKQFKVQPMTIIFALMSLIVHAQDSATIDTINFTDGKWTVCTDNKFSSGYKCNNGWTNYNFNIDGTFLETQKDIKANGTYKLRGNTLSIKRNDIEAEGSYTKYGENTFTIIWLDKNRFYSVSKDGPEGIVYTFFERIK